MPSDIKYYLDEHIPRALAEALRRRGVDVVTVQELDLMGATDEEHLANANQLGRVIVTQDSDFCALHSLGVEHAGIVFDALGHTIGQMVRGLMLIHGVLTAEDFTGCLEILPDFEN